MATNELVVSSIVFMHQVEQALLINRHGLLIAVLTVAELDLGRKRQVGRQVLKVLERQRPQDPC